MGVSLAAFIGQMQGVCYTHAGYKPPAQCTDLVAAWCDNLGLPEFSGDAATYANQRPSGWTWIANTPSGVPSPGDVMVFTKCSAQGIGGDGHTSIFISGNVDSFTSFDQNWPDCPYDCTCGQDAGSPPAITNHNYACVAGWQHPGSVPSGGTTPPPPTGGSCAGVTCGPGCTCSGGFCTCPAAGGEQGTSAATWGVLALAVGAAALLVRKYH
jgi:hypothetical protein